MSILSSLYPPLAAREPLPTYYTPLAILLSLLPFLLKQNNYLIDISIFPLLLYLCITWPCYTTGDPSADLYNNSHFIALPFWYLDFVLRTPRTGQDAPAFVGAPQKEVDAFRTPQRWEHLSNFPQRLKWAFRLMFPPAHRGIGWNWQVKGVPSHRDMTLPKWQFVTKQLWSSLRFYVLCVGTLTVVGFSDAMRANLLPEDLVWRAISTAMIGWTGATWVWARLCCSYDLGAALCVAVGLTETWEWPPLMGPLGEAWSVRQMWSVTYHQVCRRLLSQPATRIVRFLHLRKGSLASRYTQIFLTFFLSCLFHQAQMFNVTRRDMGERAFFLSQPLAIVFEDLIQWVWKKTPFSERSRRFEALVGYIWTFAWFSFSLRFYVGGMVQARVMKDWIFGYRPLFVGAEASEQWIVWLRR